MKRATITLDDELEDAVESYQGAQDIPPGLTAIAQAAIREYMEERGFLPFHARVSFHITPAEQGSGHADTSINHDAYLVEASE